MSRPRKPTALKVVAGTDRPDREAPAAAELPLVSDVPPAPDWMPNAHARKEWERLAPILHANKLLTEAGLSALGQLCALHGKTVQLYAAGEAPVASMVAQLRGLMNDFGLTPVAQGKVKPNGDTAKTSNAFAALGAPRAAGK
ncbi:P27 family phage terminase small subunit [Stenotrophomonas maltophilia]|uniref:P27 family phage terminase small subunit n=1 Tax=Stenotrophomonas maltophilia TaxID=40324 RepID=UPI0013FD6213|nr:P27 family phage terminase small subunit [Stenotrophomonas maltophilia]MCO7458414.1 P27 family phage terminase small subunit [Stenotrophomonas maltophilia]MCO7466422.1 P27 family phage terminase small subunit [Stenotrophomonas maltophilia]MCO7482570.1 P27 family phage terminase small subunit [Stenotrophomonas maltophilia]MCO7491695.1 P27 family phage terminase small subunit [Stenotrophomonas maltophilia]